MASARLRASSSSTSQSPTWINVGGASAQSPNTGDTSGCFGSSPSSRYSSVATVAESSEKSWSTSARVLYVSAVLVRSAQGEQQTTPAGGGSPASASASAV